ncbi:hypothetical protein AURDEDRAFT_175849 [Auricularia subglabra TFB-10046 SS5]|nr:hypothetical protein AURDEDRAFT_175849 [Auricularia subglabra TFB-10046 SS5]
MAPSIFDFDASFGSLEIGTFVSMFLLGIATLQAWNYFRDFSQDPMMVKLMVAAIYFADFLHSVMFAHAVHHYTISGFLNIAVLVKTVWSLEATLVIEAFIIVIVQCYFGLRVFRVTHSITLAVGIWFLALVRMGLTLGIMAASVQNGTLAVTSTRAFRYQAILETSIAAFTDVVTALALCLALLRRRTGFAHTDRLIDRIVAFTIGSGLFTSFISIAQLVAYLALSGDFVWIAFFSISSKMFSNSLLASLNERGSNRLVSLTLQRSAVTNASTRVTFTQPYVTYADQAAGETSALELGERSEKTVV